MLTRVIADQVGLVKEKCRQYCEKINCTPFTFNMFLLQLEDIPRIVHFSEWVLQWHECD